MPVYVVIDLACPATVDTDIAVVDSVFAEPKNAQRRKAEMGKPVRIELHWVRDRLDPLR